MRSIKPNMMKKKINILFLCVLILSNLTGCKSPDDYEQEQQIVIFFTTGSLSGSLLKSQASNQENLITEVKLYGAEENGNITDYQSLVPNNSGTPITISRKIKTLYAIANPINIASVSTVSALMELTADFTNAPKSPFLMSGKAEVNRNGLSTSVNIVLVRAIAKIEIEIIDINNEFAIESIVVKDTRAKGYVFERETLSVSSFSLKDYTYTNPLPKKFDVYVAENTLITPTQIFVTGKYQGETITHNFTVKGKNAQGQDVGIIRNRCYPVKICFDSCN